MGNIGDQVKRFTVVPLDAPIIAPEGPVRDTPVPEKEPTAPQRENEPVE